MTTRTGAPFTDMRTYLDYVRGLPDIRLSDAEAAELLSQGKREEVYETLLKLVPFVIQRYIDDAYRRENYQDIVQEGNIAVWKCIEAWKPGKGMSLASWGFMYCRKAVIAEVRRDVKYKSQHIQWRFDDDIDSIELDSVLTDNGKWEDMQEASARLRAIRAKLSNRDATLLDMLRDGQTQEHIAAALHLSQSRVSRLTVQVYDKIQHMKA